MLIWTLKSDMPIIVEEMVKVKTAVIDWFGRRTAPS
jgi:hypothetical protein